MLKMKRIALGALLSLGLTACAKKTEEASSDDLALREALDLAQLDRVLVGVPHRRGVVRHGHRDAPAGRTVGVGRADVGAVAGALMPPPGSAGRGPRR